MIWNTKIEVFIDFLVAIFGCETHFNSKFHWYHWR